MLKDLQAANDALEQMYRDASSDGSPKPDGLLSCLVRGGVTLIGGRPAMGKTFLTLNMVSRLAKQAEGNILIVSPCAEEELTMRLLTIGTGIPAGKLLDGSLSAEELGKCHTDFFQRQKSCIKMETFSYITPELIRWLADKVPRLRLLVVDNLARVCSREDYDRRTGVWEPAAAPLDKTLEFLKQLAQDRNIPVVCTVNLHRKLERRKNKRPKLADLENLGVTPEMADQILFLYRDAYYHWESDNSAECIVAKSDHGKTGVIMLAWQRDTCRFTERRNQHE